jgi:hypothetical protein
MAPTYRQRPTIGHAMGRVSCSVSCRVVLHVHTFDFRFEFDLEPCQSFIDFSDFRRIKLIAQPHFILTLSGLSAFELFQRFIEIVALQGPYQFKFFVFVIGAAGVAQAGGEPFATLRLQE